MVKQPPLVIRVASRRNHGTTVLDMVIYPVSAKHSVESFRIADQFGVLTHPGEVAGCTLGNVLIRNRTYRYRTLLEVHLEPATLDRLVDTALAVLLSPLPLLGADPLIIPLRLDTHSSLKVTDLALKILDLCLECHILKLMTRLSNVFLVLSSVGLHALGIRTVKLTLIPHVTDFARNTGFRAAQHGSDLRHLRPLPPLLSQHIFLLLCPHSISHARPPHEFVKKPSRNYRQNFPLDSSPEICTWRTGSRVLHLPVHVTVLDSWCLRW